MDTAALPTSSGGLWVQVWRGLRARWACGCRFRGASGPAGPLGAGLEGPQGPLLREEAEAGLREAGLPCRASLESVIILKAGPAFISLVSQGAGEPVPGGAASSISVTPHPHGGLSVHAAAKGADGTVGLAGRGGGTCEARRGDRPGSHDKALES